ncbi:hypothetical protein [Parabacteroides chongii]|uniref:hypothetical protein n=1 Tax=Parabacteroides chongii TaxID=2685834 RepID=UPI00240D643A|nr:hypothetical protein [Parabacteroides chongii]WFE84978.1 hypothetical protein P3L47_23145 [Parabacteroides chongii]
MTGDLKINSEDAWGTWRVAMGTGFIESLLTPAGLKDFIENESRLENGKRVIFNDPKIASRDVTLTFNIHGDTPQEYLSNYAKFTAELQKGKVRIQVPAIGMTFTLVYKKSTSFALDRSRMNSRLSVKFEEPDPTSR